MNCEVPQLTSGGTMTAPGLPHPISQPRDRAAAFCAKYSLQHPILLAPMAGGRLQAFPSPWPTPVGWGRWARS